MQKRAPSASGSVHSELTKTGGWSPAWRPRARERSECTELDYYARAIYGLPRKPLEKQMASNASTETVALALRELALSRGDQDRLSEFLTDYFTSEDHEISSGK